MRSRPRRSGLGGLPVEDCDVPSAVAEQREGARRTGRQILGLPAEQARCRRPSRRRGRTWPARPSRRSRLVARALSRALPPDYQYGGSCHRAAGAAAGSSNSARTAATPSPSAVTSRVTSGPRFSPTKRRTSSSRARARPVRTALAPPRRSCGSAGVAARDRLLVELARSLRRSHRPRRPERSAGASEHATRLDSSSVPPFVATRKVSV